MSTHDEIVRQIAEQMKSRRFTEVKVSNGEDVDIVISDFKRE